MSTQLFDGKDFSITQYWGGDARGVMYQITQYNKTTKRYEFIQLTKQQLKFIVKRIKEKGI